MLRAASNHAGVTVCNRHRESGLPKCLPLPGDPRFHPLATKLFKKENGERGLPVVTCTKQTKAPTTESVRAQRVNATKVPPHARSASLAATPPPAHAPLQSASEGSGLSSLMLAKWGRGCRAGRHLTTSASFCHSGSHVTPPRDSAAAWPSGNRTGRGGMKPQPFRYATYRAADRLTIATNPSVSRVHVAER